MVEHLRSTKSIRCFKLFQILLIKTLNFAKSVENLGGVQHLSSLVKSKAVGVRWPLQESEYLYIHIRVILVFLVEINGPFIKSF